ncbi:hypothetical protein BH23ACT10_BH23ACT10_14460 [soil metagenome]
MLRTDLTDHRGTDDARLVRAVADGDAIALAEAYHRTITAAHACARRLLASPVEIEALIRSVYSDLWEEPPVDEALEGWIRARCFALGTGYLRQRGLKAPSRSLAARTSGVGADGHQGNDALEQMIAELTEPQQAALVRAHDQGLRTSEQDDADAGAALQHALLVLASPLTDDERHAAEMCSSGVSLANWIFGLLPPHEAATVPGTAAEPTPCGRVTGVLRRARRRFEPLPPTPDLGHRVLAWVLGNGQSRESQQTRASRLDTDLRVASSDLDRGPGGNDAPRSSLDMVVPAAAPTEPDRQPVSAVRSDDDPAGGWPSDGASRGHDGNDRPTPLRPSAGSPALTGSATSPAAFSNGNAAPALAPQLPEPDDEVSEELVRMPLTRAARPRLASTTDPTAHSRSDDATETIPPVRSDDAQPPPPVALRRGADDDTSPAPVRPDAGGPRALDSGDGPAPSPLSAEEQRGSLTGQNHDTESPLRRPAPALPGPPRNRDLDTEPHSLLVEPPPADRARPDDRSSDDTAAAPAPIRRDDSDPRFDELFGHNADAGPPALASSDDRVTNLTAPTLPATQRPTQQQQQPSRPPTPSQPATPGPTLAHTEPEPATGNSVVRWLVVLLLIAAGAAVGIMLGQTLI